MPVFVQNDIVNLPKYNIYLKLMIDGIAGDAFSAKVLPPVYIGDTVDNEEKIIAASRERYASSKEEVEDKISRWAGVMPVGGFQTVNKAPEGQVIQNPNNVRYVAPQNQPQQAAHRNFAPQIQQPAAPVAQASQPVAARQSAQPRASVSAPAFTRSSEPSKVIQPQVVVEKAPINATAPINQDDLGEYNQLVSAPQIEQPAAVQPQKEEENPDYYVKPVDERPKFDAICDMCGEQIQIPFQPDGKRPTFCKDCLKEYQRMNAKEKLNQERKMQRQQEEKQEQSPISTQAPKPVRTPVEAPRYGTQSMQATQASKPVERKIEHKAYVSKDRPMSLSQMQHMAPKQFKPQRTRPQINLDEVRKMIDENKQ
jgi:CxxC-x17-CxxC domain-containing protein